MPMPIKLSFLGAAQNVTGSRYLLEADGCRVLVDCGLYQERELRGRNWDPFPVPAESIDAILLTHAHADHCGLLPKLVKEGFRGPVYCTAATAEIAQILLTDAAHLAEEDARFKQRRHEREGRRGPHPEAPLFTVQDARASFKLLQAVRYGEPIALANGVGATLHDAGHILGSAMVMVTVREGVSARRILFSGDVGRWDKPILRDPTLFSDADYVLVESTYGDRVHDAADSVERELEDVINATRKARGNVVIPSFAIERSQELLFHLHQLLMADRIPHLAVFVDSPMAIRVTEVFAHHPDLFDEEMLAAFRQRQSPFDFDGLKMCRTQAESKSINHILGSAIIIAGSGMCTGGRVKHHLAHNISRPECTILFVGFQAAGTLGREIVDHARAVRILGETRPVRARIARLDGLSAHADRDELLRWVSALKRPPRRIFVTHGEPEVADSFAAFLSKKTGWQTTVAKYQDVHVLA